MPLFTFLRSRFGHRKTCNKKSHVRRQREKDNPELEPKLILNYERRVADDSEPFNKTWYYIWSSCGERAIGVLARDNRIWLILSVCVGRRDWMSMDQIHFHQHKMSQNTTRIHAGHFSGLGHVFLTKRFVSRILMGTKAVKFEAFDRPLLLIPKFRLRHVQLQIQTTTKLN